MPEDLKVVVSIRLTIEPGTKAWELTQGGDDLTLLEMEYRAFTDDDLAQDWPGLSMDTSDANLMEE